MGCRRADGQYCDASWSLYWRSMAQIPHWHPPRLPAGALVLRKRSQAEGVGSYDLVERLLTDLIRRALEWADRVAACFTATMRPAGSELTLRCPGHALRYVAGDLDDAAHGHQDESARGKGRRSPARKPSRSAGLTGGQEDAKPPLASPVPCQRWSSHPFGANRERSSRTAA